MNLGAFLFENDLGAVSVGDAKEFFNCYDSTYGCYEDLIVVLKKRLGLTLKIEKTLQVPEDKAKCLHESALRAQDYRAKTIVLAQNYCAKTIVYLETFYSILISAKILFLSLQSEEELNENNVRDVLVPILQQICHNVVFFGDLLPEIFLKTRANPESFLRPCAKDNIMKLSLNCAWDNRFIVKNIIETLSRNLPDQFSIFTESSSVDQEVSLRTNESNDGEGGKIEKTWALLNSKKESSYAKIDEGNHMLGERSDENLSIGCEDSWSECGCCKLM